MNQACCLDLVQNWDGGTELCVMQGVNEQHAWARLDLFLMVLTKLYVRYLSAQLLGPHKTYLFCNKKIWQLHQDLKKQLEPNGTIRLHHFSDKIWKKPLLIGKYLRLQAHVCQNALKSNLLSLHLILSCGCPTTAFDFFTPCEGLRAETAATPSLLVVFQSSSCSPALKARVWLISCTDCEASGGERLWGETSPGKRARSVTHQTLNGGFSKYCSTVFYIVQENWWQVT